VVIRFVCIARHCSFTLICTTHHPLRQQDPRAAAAGIGGAAIAAIVAAEAVAAPGFTFAGAIGDNASIINGKYLKLKRKLNGKSVYSKVRAADWVCWFSSMGWWHITTTKVMCQHPHQLTHQHPNLPYWYIRSNDLSLDAPQLEENGWAVRTNNLGESENQPTVTITIITEADVQADRYAVVAARASAVVAPGFTLAGTIGGGAPIINGTYAKLDEQKNGKSVYGQVEDPEYCCWYEKDKSWTVSTIANKDANKATGLFAYSVQIGLAAPQLVEVWCDTETDDAQPSITITNLTEAELLTLDPARAAAAAAPAHAAALAAAGFTFAGVVGVQAPYVNGTYAKLSGEQHNGKSVYRQVGDPKLCCWYGPHRKWMVSNTIDKDANAATGFAHSVERGLDAPQSAHRWIVGVGGDAGWEVQPTVTTTNLTEMQVHRAADQARDHANQPGKEPARKKAKVADNVAAVAVRGGGGAAARNPPPTPAVQAPIVPTPAMSAPIVPTMCPKVAAAEFLRFLNINPAYLAPEWDRCYCVRCYVGPDTIRNDGPTPYVIPHGWVRFGLALPPRAHAENVFTKWNASFHGVKSVLVLKSILQNGSLMKPGDVLMDRTILKSTKCGKRQDEVIYTSPTIRYAGKIFYAEPLSWSGNTMHGSIAMQCRQAPGTFTPQGETMQFERRMPGHLKQHCPHVDLGTIEWFTKANTSIIPYGLLVRVWPAGADLEKEAYSSPVDGSII
jgi:hypothetical protein